MPVAALDRKPCLTPRLCQGQRWTGSLALRSGPAKGNVGQETLPCASALLAATLGRKPCLALWPCSGQRWEGNLALRLGPARWNVGQETLPCASALPEGARALPVAALGRKPCFTPWPCQGQRWTGNLALRSGPARENVGQETLPCASALLEATLGRKPCLALWSCLGQRWAGNLALRLGPATPPHEK